MEAIVELRGVSKTYRIGDETVHALDRVDLVIPPRTVVAVTGPSGAGKSTLANVIGGLDRPDEGTVRVGPHVLERTSDRELSKFRNTAIGFVFQSFNLQPHLTAVENVAMPLAFSGVSRSKRRARAASVLSDVGLGDRTKHLPGQLSGGQRQRVAIARALVNQPELIIADEPTGNLDSQRGAEILDLLVGAVRERGATLMIITHDPDVACRADGVLHVRDGAVTGGAR
jgi:putative ABC transport system ATP-binding protein